MLYKFPNGLSKNKKENQHDKHTLAHNTSDNRKQTKKNYFYFVSSKEQQQNKIKWKRKNGMPTIQGEIISFPGFHGFLYFHNLDQCHEMQNYISLQIYFAIQKNNFFYFSIYQMVNINR